MADSILSAYVRALVDCFEDVVRQAPDRTLLVAPGAAVEWSASDLWAAHVEYQCLLKAAGLQSGNLLVCAVGNHHGFLPILLACRSLDVVMMPLDVEASGQRAQALSRQYGAAACLTRAGHDCSSAGATLLPGDLVLRRAGVDAVRYPGAAMLKLTSGTTDTARATRTTEAQLIADGDQIIAGQRIEVDQRQMAAIPLEHSYALGVILLPLLVQGTSFVLRDTFVPRQMLSDVRALEVRRFPGVPFMFEYFVEHLPSHEWPAGLTHLVSAGAPLSPASARIFHDRFGVKIHSYYGATETGGIAFDDSPDVGVDDAIEVGRPLPGVSVSLRPMAGLPEGCGRVFVESPAVSDGYIDGDRSLFAGGGFMTGDYGSQDAGGRLTLRGRISSFINVAGRKVQPDEVESVLRGMPGVADVRVVGSVDVRRGQQVVACVVARAGVSPPTAADLRRFCASRLPAYKIPRALVLLDAIPLTARGKTDRIALQQLVQGQYAPQTGKEGR